MDNTTLRKYLLREFARFAVDLRADDDDWLASGDHYPAVRARWHEGVAGRPGRLDIDVALDAMRCIEESFAGAGTGEAGCQIALRAFEHNLLPVLLAACWGVTDNGNPRVQQWMVGDREWDAFIGPFTLRGAADDALVIPAGAVAAVQQALARQALTPQWHWLRLVHGFRVGGSARSEVLLDNEPWSAAGAALATVAWPDDAHDYTARCFLMLELRPG